MDAIREVREILVVLTRRYAFREVAYLLGCGAAGIALKQRAVARVQQICAYGQRLLDLDAEDLADSNAARGATTDTRVADLVSDEFVPNHLVERGRLCQIRQSPTQGPVDALVSLLPAYRLLLEIIAIRWRRRETLALVAAIHIASEYAPLLAWQPALGHAGNPFALRQDPAFVGSDSRWGHMDDHKCAHSMPDRSAARRALRVSDEPQEGWQSYLDRQHSHVSHALGVCAAVCSRPCSVVTSRSAQQRTRLAQAARIARAYADCALVRLRHTAPVGHGFGVPSPIEVTQAWERSRAVLARRGGLGAAALADDGFPLPGLPSLFSAIAATPLVPDTLLADTAAAIINELDPDGVVP